MNNLDSLWKGTPSAQDTQNKLSYQALIEDRDFEAEISLLRAAIANENARAMGAYGAMHALGHGIQKNSQEAYCWFLQGATHGDIRSQVALGMCLAAGFGTAMNRKEAAYWLYRAGKAGNFQAIEMLGMLAFKDHSIVGSHFSEAELIRLCYEHQKKLRMPRAPTGSPVQ